MDLSQMAGADEAYGDRGSGGGHEGAKVRNQVEDEDEVKDEVKVEAP
jgi:hypothetical protein